MQSAKVQTTTGIWEVLLKGDECMIVDERGRCRHCSKGHMNTAVCLAGRFAEQPLPAETSSDRALRLLVEMFRKRPAKPQKTKAH